VSAVATLPEECRSRSEPYRLASLTGRMSAKNRKIVREPPARGRWLLSFVGSKQTRIYGSGNETKVSNL
jgi:hypothetical protein